eukprot:511999-Prymnesium_polylepis.1
MSGREVFEGNHERMGAHVIENANLAQPPPPRAGPNRFVKGPFGPWSSPSCALVRGIPSISTLYHNGEYGTGFVITALL